MSGSPYEVTLSAEGKRNIHELAKMARQADKIEQFQSVLHSLVDQLATSPIGGVELKFEQQTPRVIECFDFFRYLALHYLVYEELKGVEILSIDLIPMYSF